jgi:hypothetical protein
MEIPRARRSESLLTDLAPGCVEIEPFSDFLVTQKRKGFSRFFFAKSLRLACISFLFGSGLGIPLATYLFQDSTAVPQDGKHLEWHEKAFP